METNQDRALAYNLAKELDHKDLGEVSGGASSWSWSNKKCAGITGDDRSPDAQVDVVVDW